MAWTVKIDVFDVVDEKQTIKRIETNERFGSKANAEERARAIEEQGYKEYQKKDIIKAWPDEIREGGS